MVIELDTLIEWTFSIKLKLLAAELVRGNLLLLLSGLSRCLWILTGVGVSSCFLLDN